MRRLRGESPGGGLGGRLLVRVRAGGSGRFAADCDRRPESVLRGGESVGRPQPQLFGMRGWKRLKRVRMR